MKTWAKCKFLAVRSRLWDQFSQFGQDKALPIAEDASLQLDGDELARVYVLTTHSIKESHGLYRL